METQRGTSSQRIGDLVDIQTEVQRWSTGDLYTKMIRLGIRCKYGGACGKIRSACGWRWRMEKAYGGGMVAKEDMWDNVVMMKGRKYTMESELTKRR